MAGIIGNKHHLHFTTLIIMKSEGKRMKFNANGTTRIPRTVHGTVRSTGGDLVRIPVSRSAVPRRIVKAFYNNGMVLGPTGSNSKMSTNKPIHTIIRLTNVTSVADGSLNSGAPVGVMHTAVSNLGRLGGTRSITGLHNGSIRRLLKWKKLRRNEDGSRFGARLSQASSGPGECLRNFKVIRGQRGYYRADWPDCLKRSWRDGPLDGVEEDWVVGVELGRIPDCCRAS